MRVQETNSSMCSHFVNLSRQFRKITRAVEIFIQLCRQNNEIQWLFYNLLFQIPWLFQVLKIHFQNLMTFHDRGNPAHDENNAYWIYLVRLWSSPGTMQEQQTAARSDDGCRSVPGCLGDLRSHLKDTSSVSPRYDFQTDSWTYTTPKQCIYSAISYNVDINIKTLYYPCH